MELHRRVLTNVIKQRISTKSKKIVRAEGYPSVLPIYLWLISGVEVPSISLRPLCFEIEGNVASIATRSSKITLSCDLYNGFIKSYQARKEAIQAVDPLESSYWRIKEHDLKQDES